MTFREINFIMEIEYVRHMRERKKNEVCNKFKQTSTAICFFVRLETFLHIDIGILYILMSNSFCSIFKVFFACVIIPINNVKVKNKTKPNDRKNNVDLN